jgi:hypothetical protein
VTDQNEESFSLPDFDPSKYNDGAPIEPAPQPEPKKNKGGAPRGNTNALKHGFYSRHFKARELKDLDSQTDLDDEIKFVRVCIRRISEKAENLDSLEQGLDYLRAISHAAYIITRMVKIRNGMGENLTFQDYFSMTMDEAIARIRAERGWK